jgi:hypothetical protein
MLERFRERGLVKARGRQRTDSTHVLGSLRVLNRLELIGETLRAALNALATVAPERVRSVAPAEWFQRYAHRIEESRLPRGKEARETYARTMGEDGFAWRTGSVLFSSPTSAVTNHGSQVLTTLTFTGEGPGARTAGHAKVCPAPRPRGAVR